jgi:hypothetical protein
MSFGSLTHANRGNFGVVFGQSNANRCGNKPGSATAAGFSKPAAATYYDFVTQAGVMASYSAPHHSIETGLLDELCVVNGKAVTLAKRGMDGTSLAQWNSTHAATLKSDITTAALGIPKWGILVQGENEAGASQGAADTWDTDLITLRGNLCASWGAAFGLIVVRLHPSSSGTWTANARVRQDYACSAQWHIGKVTTDDLALADDSLHFSSAMATEVGRRCARLLLSAGLVT